MSAMSVIPQRRCSLFPTTVCEYLVHDWQAINRAVLRFADLGGGKGLRQSLLTHAREAELEALRSACLAACADFARCLSWAPRPFELSEMWINSLPPGAAHPVHQHANNLLSGVYFVQVEAEERTHELLLLDPRPQAHLIEPAIDEMSALNAQQVALPAQPGHLYVFPSWLAHRVSTNDGSVPRVTVSFNAITRELGKHETLTFANWPSPT